MRCAIFLHPQGFATRMYGIMKRQYTLSLLYRSIREYRSLAEPYPASSFDGCSKLAKRTHVSLNNKLLVCPVQYWHFEAILCVCLPRAPDRNDEFSVAGLSPHFQAPSSGAGGGVSSAFEPCTTDVLLQWEIVWRIHCPIDGPHHCWLLQTSGDSLPEHVLSPIGSTNSSDTSSCMAW